MSLKSHLQRLAYVSGGYGYPLFVISLTIIGTPPRWVSIPLGVLTLVLAMAYSIASARVRMYQSAIVEMRGKMDIPYTMRLNDEAPNPE